jgi:hypothetical protein
MSVADVQRLFAENDAPHDAAQAAREALARAARAQLNTEGSDEARTLPRLPRRSRLAALGVLGDLFAATIGRAAGWLLSQVVRVLKYRPVRWAAMLTVTAATVWAVYWFLVLPRLPIASAEVLAEYRQLWDDVEAAGKDAGSADWDRLTARAESLAFRHELPLRHHATARQPIVQELMWATPLLSQAVTDVRDGRADKSQQVAKVRIHLQNAERLAVRQQEIAEEQPVASRAPLVTTGDGGIDTLFVAFLAFDALVAVAIVWYALRRVARR